MRLEGAWNDSIATTTTTRDADSTSTNATTVERGLYAVSTRDQRPLDAARTALSGKKNRKRETAVCDSTPPPEV